MLQRILEPEVMDSLEEARDYDSMDHAEVNRIFVADFLEVWPAADTVLDVGTGTAQIPIELCRRAPAAMLTAVDLAGEMLQIARDNVRRAGFEPRIQIECGDAKKLPFQTNRFDAVISNSLIHHIADPEPVLAEMMRVLRPGGWLFVRDLLRPPSTEILTNLVSTYTGNASDSQQQMFAESLHAALSLAEIQALAARLGIDSKQVQQTTDRHWTLAEIKTSIAPP